MIGVIGAMPEEIDIIKEEMENIEEIIISDLIFYKGTFNKKNIILVKSGIGMVNAALTTTLLISKFNVNKIIFSGVAGSLNKNIKIGDIVISTELEEYLFDATAFGYKKGEIPQMNTSIFKSRDLLNEVKEILKNDKIFYGKIVSGDKFISEKKEKESIGLEFNALAVDMESSAVAHVCHTLDIDFIIIRSISDSLIDESVMEYNEFVKIAAKNSKNILSKII